MSIVSDKTQLIIQQVMEYKKSGDRTVLERYSVEDFEHAITEYSHYHGGSEYEALKSVYAAIKSNRDSASSHKLTWTVFWLSVIASLIVGAILGYMFK